jgi:hypothetical protein
MSTYEAYIFDNRLVLTSTREKTGIRGYIDLDNKTLQLDSRKLRVLDGYGKEVIPTVQLTEESSKDILDTMSHVKPSKCNLNMEYL